MIFHPKTRLTFGVSIERAGAEFPEVGFGFHGFILAESWLEREGFNENLMKSFIHNLIYF